MSGRPPSFEHASEIVEGEYLELVVEELDAFLSETGQRGHVAQLTR